MRDISKVTLSLAVATALSLGISGCGSSSDDATTTQDDNNESGESIAQSQSYNGAGSRWDLSFESDGNATIRELNSNLEINATYEDLTSGFRKITVLNSSDSSITNATVTYGFELPGYMFPFVSFTENKLIPTVVKGECIEGVLKHNLIVAYAKANSAQSDFDSWGSYGYWIADTLNEVTKIEVFKRDGSVKNSMEIEGSSTLTSACNNGQIYDPVGNPDDEDNAITTAYFSKNGALIWQQDAMNDERVENNFMLPYEANLNAINEINGNYIGYVISGNGQTSYENTPVSVVATDGSLSLKNIDVVTNQIGTQIGTITLTNEVSGTKGLWSGTLEISQATEGIGCAVDLDAAQSGKNVIICGGMKPDGTLKNLYSLILVSK